MADDLDKFLDGDEIDSFLDAPADQPAQPGLGARAAEFIAEEGTPAAGAMIGAAASLPFAPAAGPFAPLVPIAGAAMGAAGARGLQRSYQYLTGLRPIPATSGEVAEEIASSAKAAAIGEGGGALLGAGIRAATPAAKSLFKQAARGFAGIRENVTEQAIRRGSKLYSAAPAEEAGRAYEAFERYTGLRGIQAQEVATGELPSPTSMIKSVYETANKVYGGQAVDPQELYTASQYAARLKQMSKFQNPPPEVVARAAAIDQSKGLVDDALEAALPEYGSIRRGYAASKVKDQFSSFAPLQRNLSPDALRMSAQGFSAGSAAMSGNPLAIAGVAAFSPMTYGATIVATDLAKKALESTAGTAVRKVAAQSLAEEYMKRRQARDNAR